MEPGQKYPCQIRKKSEGLSGPLANDDSPSHIRHAMTLWRLLYEVSAFLEMLILPVDPVFEQ